ncbi:DUF1003 domain-containing protein [Chamaesiphon sp.]|uniref:DUF1003 domain-containing protein n=1 Tax=Chamaesiphon sp. TaxID=2814140 RepID=UPI003593DDBB
MSIGIYLKLVDPLFLLATMTAKTSRNLVSQDPVAAVSQQAVVTELLEESVESSAVSEQVLRNIETITNYQERYHKSASIAQRVLDQFVSIFGKPQFLYFQILFFTIWEICGHLVDLGMLPASFPQIDLREQWLDLASLFISTGVLVSENRQGKLSEERSHLVLQLNLITEQKIAKLISLVEELRTDLPNVRNRNDLEAEMMKQSTDPQVILEVIQKISDPSAIEPEEDTPDET